MDLAPPLGENISVLTIYYITEKHHVTEIQFWLNHHLRSGRYTLINPFWMNGNRQGQARLEAALKRAGHKWPGQITKCGNPGKNCERWVKNGNETIIACMCLLNRSPKEPTTFCSVIGKLTNRGHFTQHWNGVGSCVSIWLITTIINSTTAI